MGQVLSQNHFVCKGEDIKEKVIIISKTEMLNEQTKSKHRPSFTFLSVSDTAEHSTELNRRLPLQPLPKA